MKKLSKNLDKRIGKLEHEMKLKEQRQDAIEERDVVMTQMNQDLNKLEADQHRQNWL